LVAVLYEDFLRDSACKEAIIAFALGSDTASKVFENLMFSGTTNEEKLYEQQT